MTFFGNNEDRLYFKNKLRDVAFSSMYNLSSSCHKLLNLPKEELRALKELSKNRDIVILKPDKGTGVVILNTEDYVNKAQQIVLDETKFSQHAN